MNPTINQKLEGMRQQLEAKLRVPAHVFGRMGVPIGPSGRGPSTAGLNDRPNKSPAHRGYDFEKLINNVKYLTDRNDHTASRALVARTVFPSHKKFVQAWDGLEALHNYHGELTHGLKAARDEMEEILFQMLRRTGMDDEDLNIITSAL